MRAWRMLAVVQPPMTFWLPDFTQAIGTSSAMVVMLFSARGLGTALRVVSLVIAAAGALMRSKTGPRFTAKLSLRCPTNTFPGVGQPGMSIGWMKLAAYAAYVAASPSDLVPT